MAWETYHAISWVKIFFSVYSPVFEANIPTAIQVWE
jgi:hypothetical protein